MARKKVSAANFSKMERHLQRLFNRRQELELIGKRLENPHMILTLQTGGILFEPEANVAVKISKYPVLKKIMWAEVVRHRRSITAQVKKTTAEMR